MKPCTAALASFLDGNPKEAIQIDLYTVALVTGEIFRWSGGTAALTVPAAGFADPLSLNYGADRVFALGPRFGRSKVTSKIGVEPAELVISLYPRATDLVGTLSVAAAAARGAFDGATVELDRFFAPPQSTGDGLIDTSLGVLVWFQGRVNEIEIGRSVVTITVKSLMQLIATTQMPRRVFGSGCTHVFGGAMCGYDRILGLNALGAATGWGQQAITAAAGSSQLAIYSSYLPGVSPSPYNEGTIVGTAGENTGFKRSIQFHDAATGTVWPNLEWIYPVAVGDTFALLPGCPHTATYCEDTLNNLDRYGGFPHIPPPESAV